MLHGTPTHSTDGPHNRRRPVTNWDLGALELRGNRGAPLDTNILFYYGEMHRQDAREKMKQKSP